MELPKFVFITSNNILYRYKNFVVLKILFASMTNWHCFHIENVIAVNNNLFMSAAKLH